jgi:hypothetical protein
MSSGPPISIQDLKKQKEELRIRIKLLKDDPLAPESEILATRRALQNIDTVLFEMGVQTTGEGSTAAVNPASASRASVPMSASASASDSPEPVSVMKLELKIRELELRCAALKNQKKIVDREAQIEQVSQKIQHLQQNLRSAKFIEKAIQNMYDETEKNIDDLEKKLSGLSIMDDEVITLPEDLETLIPFRVFSNQPYKTHFNKDIDTVKDLKYIVTQYKAKPSIKPLFDTSQLFTDINVTLHNMSNIYFNFLLSDGRRVTVSLHSKESKNAKGALHIYTKYTTIPTKDVRASKFDEYPIEIEKNVAENRFRIHLTQIGRDYDVEELYQIILDFIAQYLTLVMNGEKEFLGKKRKSSKKRMYKKRKSSKRNM